MLRKNEHFQIITLTNLKSVCPASSKLDYCHNIHFITDNAPFEANVSMYADMHESSIFWQPYVSTATIEEEKITHPTIKYRLLLKEILSFQYQKTQKSTKNTIKILVKSKSAQIPDLLQLQIKIP